MVISKIWNKKVLDRIVKATSTKHEKIIFFFENKLKKLENNTNYIENSEYIDCRNKLN